MLTVEKKGSLVAYKPLDILTLVLKQLKEDAERLLGSGKTVRQAVLTVPACFGTLQRASIMGAAAKAGLDVLRLIPKPSAAALAYNHNQRRWVRCAFNTHH